MRRIVLTEKAPRPLGPYSQAVIEQNLVYVSGQLGIDVQTGKPGEGIEEQTRLAIKNLEAILQEAGSSLSKVLKVTIILKNIDDFASMNKVYSEFFKTDPPSRTTFQANLPAGYLIELDAVATLV